MSEQMDLSYITIYDNTLLAKIIFVSESITEILGYTPTELLQVEGYSLTHPDEHAALRLFHNYSNVKQSTCFLLTYRLRHKEGHFVTLDALLQWCNNILITTTFVSNHLPRRTMRAHSADEFFVIENGQIQSSIPIPPEVNWPDAPPEPRFSLILNRYSEQSQIVFATSLCESMVGLDQLESVGRSLFEFVAPEDQKWVRSQLELSKASNVVVKVKFSWLVPGTVSRLMEAVLSCTSDGLVMLLRCVDVIYRTIPQS